MSETWDLDIDLRRQWMDEINTAIDEGTHSFEFDLPNMKKKKKRGRPPKNNINTKKTSGRKAKPGSKKRGRKKKRTADGKCLRCGRSPSPQPPPLPAKPQSKPVEVGVGGDDVDVEVPFEWILPDPEPLEEGFHTPPDQMISTPIAPPSIRLDVSPLEKAILVNGKIIFL